jgi:hypothetical protein
LKLVNLPARRAGAWREPVASATTSTAWPAGARREPMATVTTSTARRAGGQCDYVVLPSILGASPPRPPGTAGTSSSW